MLVCETIFKMTNCRKVRTYNITGNYTTQDYSCGGGGVLTPKKAKKKPSQFTNFGVATVFFCFFLVFLGWYSNPKYRCQKIPKENQKNKKKKKTKKTRGPKKPKKPKKNQKKPKKNQFPISNVGQGLCKKNQKKQETPKNQFPISNSGQNQCQKTKEKQIKNQCQFTDFGVATVLLGEHPPSCTILFFRKKKRWCMQKFGKFTLPKILQKTVIEKGLTQGLCLQLKAKEFKQRFL